MKKLFLILLTIAAFAMGADVKPFVYGNIAKDSSTQQNQYDYMLQYKLYGRDYMDIGIRVRIPDKSGWNGSSGNITSKEQLVLGGPVLTDSSISLGNECKLTTGPIHANTFTSSNDNGNALFAGNICLVNPVDANSETMKGITRADGKFTCDNVPDAPSGLTMPTIVFPDTTQMNITVPDRGKVFIDIPDVPSYDLYVNSIRTGTEDTLYFRMANRGTLTRVFVKDDITLGNHTVIQTFYNDSAVAQDKYRGNLLFYTTKDINLINSDNTEMQGTYISTQKIYLACNINFAGQLLANQLQIGNDFKGENFHFVKFDPDTLDFPALDKNAGLRENDSTVIIPIQLSDTSTIDVYFTYCFDLKEGVTVDDFNMPPEIPVCGTNQSITTKIPIGSKTPLDTIKVNIKIDTLTEPNEFLIMRIDSITGAILPNGETSGELKIKIKDAPNKHVEFDTTAIYKFNENDTGFVSYIKVFNETQFTRFYLDSSWTDRYTLDSITGELRLVKDPLDYEATTVDMIKVTLKDAGNVEVSRLIPIGVQDVNEAPTLNDTTFTLYENVPVPSLVGTLNVNEPDIRNADFRQNLFKIVEGDSCFTIDNTGKIYSSKIFNYEKDTTEFKLKVMVYDKNYPTTLFDTATVTIKIGNTNEGPKFPTKDTTCSVEENYIGNVCKIPGTDDDGTKPTFIVTDTTIYKIDSTGQLVIKNPIDYEKKSKDTVKVIITDGEFSDTATVIINVIDEDEIPEITKIDDKPPVDTIKTNDPDHKIEYNICEKDNCENGKIDITVHKDTTVKVCNTKKTKCDSVVILFNDVQPVVTLTNAKSTDTYIDYITIEEQKDDKIYVNKKENPITVTVKDTIHKTEKHFEIKVKLDTIPTKEIKLKEYNYLIDETKATINPIGGNKGELVEIIKDNGTEVTIKQIIDLKTGKPIDTVQTVSYTKKVNGKDVVVTYKTDNLTGQKIGDYEVSYMVDSCTKVTYTMNDKKQIIKNEEGNIGYTITYDYVDDFGNKASASVEIVYDDIPPKVEILEPYEHEIFKTNAITVKWTVNGEVQDTLTLQRLEKGPNTIIRRYVDKAGNVSADTVWVIMKEAKDIDITIIHPVTEINKDKVDEFYSTGEKYDPKKPYKVTIVNPKDDSLPETIGIGFKIDIALPSVSPTGGLADLSDIVKNGQIPVDDKGNVVGASNLSIPVEKYVEEHCTAEFQEDYRKNGLNIPLYDVKYNLHLWVWTTTANYVNDFNVEYTLNDQEMTSEAGTVQMVVDWLADKEVAVRAKGGKALGTGAYIVKLYSKSVAKHRCDYKDQVKGDKTVKKEENMKTFGYKRPTKK